MVQSYKLIVDFVYVQRQCVLLLPRCVLLFNCNDEIVELITCGHWYDLSICVHVQDAKFVCPLMHCQGWCLHRLMLHEVDGWAPFAIPILLNGSNSFTVYKTLKPIYLPYLCNGGLEY